MKTEKIGIALVVLILTLGGIYFTSNTIKYIAKPEAVMIRSDAISSANVVSPIAIDEIDTSNVLGTSSQKENTRPQTAPGIYARMVEKGLLEPTNE